MWALSALVSDEPAFERASPPGRLHEGFAESVVARAFVAKPEDFGTANPTLWDSVESDGLDPGPTTSSAVHKSKNASNYARNVNTNSLNYARNPSFSGDFFHAIALASPHRARFTVSTCRD